MMQKPANMGSWYPILKGPKREVQFEHCMEDVDHLSRVIQVACNAQYIYIQILTFLPIMIHNIGRQG